MCMYLYAYLYSMRYFCIILNHFPAAHLAINYLSLCHTAETYRSVEKCP